MAHIHTNPGDHDHTASAFIVRTDKEFSEPKIMLHRHKKLGLLLQFGGHVETNETPWQAIAHELSEESGYDLKLMSIMQPKTRIKSLNDTAQLHPIPINHNTHRFDGLSDHRHSDLGYMFITDHPPTMEIDEGESEDIQLFTREELMNLKSEIDIYENIRDISLFCLDIATSEGTGWETVPASEFKV